MVTSPLLIYFPTTDLVTTSALSTAGFTGPNQVTKHSQKPKFTLRRPSPN